MTSVDKNINRAERFVSHALVEVRRFKKLPFFVQSGILLDMSSAGFKIELTSNNARATPGETLWLHIPLSPLGIRGPGSLSCRVEIRWFEQNTSRIGGVFVALDNKALLVIEQIISRLREDGNQL